MSLLNSEAYIDLINIEKYTKTNTNLFLRKQLNKVTREDSDFPVGFSFPPATVFKVLLEDCYCHSLIQGQLIIVLSIIREQHLGSFNCTGTEYSMLEMGIHNENQFCRT